MKVLAALILMSLIASCSSGGGVTRFYPSNDDPIVTRGVEFINGYYRSPYNNSRQYIKNVQFATKQVVNGFINYVLILNVAPKHFAGGYQECTLNIRERSLLPVHYQLTKPVDCVNRGMGWATT